jgi:hypothetical protein
MTTTAAVRSLLLSGLALTPYEMQKETFAMTGIWSSDSTITARIRDMSKPQFGGHTVVKHARPGSKAYEYSLQLDAQKSLF